MRACALSALALALALTSSAQAYEAKNGSREMKIVQIASVNVVAAFVCRNVEPDSAGQAGAMKGYGITEADLVDKRYAADIAELTDQLRKDPVNGCKGIEEAFGPQGTVILGLVKPREQRKPITERFPDGSPENKAALLMASSSYVRGQCKDMEISQDTFVSTLNGLEVPQDHINSPALANEAMNQVAAYVKDPKGCDTAWGRFGDQGSVIAHVITKKQ
ncbi:hypothetical protein [Methylobacterium oryzae]|uniref:hypothetical protein n=1 Tax=Methylobacterium oryzae TaxID=334852 RepID=UPI001F3D46FF|nr:hypothetical protein [Methylobacterium oryzae]UIN38372.1 hypothetical protein LXM90_30790 [Methylobacterium oryzae]